MKKYLMLLLPVLFLLPACRDNDQTVPFSPNYTDPGVKVNYFTSPVEGDIWNKGSRYEIKWNAFQKGGKIDLILLKKQQYLQQTIASNIDNTGYITWDVPLETVSSISYQIKIVWKATGEASYSKVFEIN